MISTTTTPAAVNSRLLIGAVSHEIARPTVTRKYVLGLAVTAIAVLLLPVLYLSLIGLVLTGLFVWVRHAEFILPAAPFGVRLLVVILPVGFGLASIAGLFKPLLAKTRAMSRPRQLGRDAEPLLVAYINRLCESLGAPRPTAIHVSCDLNAGAELRQGWFGLFGDRGISLHLGLPLVAGLTLKQFTGVLAHELGHFTQRTAMGLENLIRRINHGFLHAAAEPDAVDEWLQRHAGDAGLMSVISWIIMGLVWLPRRVLWGFALAGSSISGLMSREMEFNADRCQVRVVGAGSLTATMRRLRELNVAHEISFRDIASFYEEGRLPDDLIALLMANVSFITPKLKSQLQRMMAEEKLSLFDSHPTDQDRIQRAAGDHSPGIFPAGSFAEAVPASILFARFEEISKSVTEQYYRSVLNQKIPLRMLHPVKKLLERQNEERDAIRALRRYFQTEIPLLRPLPIAPQSTEVPEDPAMVAKELKSSCSRMLGELPRYRQLIPRYQMAEGTLFETIAAQALLQAKLDFEPSEFHLEAADVDAVTIKQGRAREGVANLAGKMLPFESEAGNRLSFALQLLQVPKVLKKIPDGEDVWFEIRDLLPAAQYVSRLIGELPALRIVFHRLMTLWQRTNGSRSNGRLIEMILSQLSSLRSRLISIQHEMGTHLYPFDHAEAETTLRDYALPWIPEEFDLGGLVEATDLMQSRLIVVQSRLFARLARAAEKVEQALGMSPLPEPQEDGS
jgi:hypothetical protein